MSLDPSPNRDELARLAAQWQEQWQADVRHVEVHRDIAEPTLTVLIIAYRSKDFLLTAIDRVRACPLPQGVTMEVVVADCGGIDALRPALKARADRVLTLTPDIGLNPARNASLAWCRGEIVALLDDDGEVRADFVQNALAYFADPTVLAIRGRIVFKDHRYFTTLASHYDRGDAVIDDTLAVEGHMAIRRGAYYLSGGFGNKFYGGEGAWLTYQLLKTFPGHRVIYAPDVVMRHDFFQSWEHFYKKSVSYSNILDKIAAQEPQAIDFQRYLHAEWARRMPRSPMRPDERVAWVALNAARFVLQRVVPAARTIAKDRSTASPRR